MQNNVQYVRSTIPSRWINANMHLTPRLFCNTRARNKGKCKWELTSDGGLIYCRIDYSSPSPEEPPRVRSLAVISPHGRNPVWAEKIRKKKKPPLLPSVVKELTDARFAMEIWGVRSASSSCSGRIWIVLGTELTKSRDKINAKKDRMLAVLIYGIELVANLYTKGDKSGSLSGKKLRFFFFFFPWFLQYSYIVRRLMNIAEFIAV